MYPTQQSSGFSSQQPIVFAIPQTLPQVTPYQCRQSIVNGILQIILGVACIILNAVSVGTYLYGFIGHGFWGGIFYIIAGSLGIAAGKTKTKCTIIAFMVLCIIAASLFAPAHLVVSALGASSLAYFSGYYSNYAYLGGPYAIEIILALLAVAELAFAIWGSTIWCKTVGCCCSNPQTVSSVQTVQMINGQPTVVMQGHGGHVVPMVVQQQHYPNYPMPNAPGYDQQVKH